ncbi:MAG: Hpt domain-containing protein [Bacteroidia bacterium]
MNNANSTPVCNLDYLYDLSKGDTEFIREMIGIFLSENPSEISRLEKGIAEKNYDVIRHASHKLRSTLPFVGLDRLIEKETIEIEGLANDHTNLPRIKELFGKVKDICQKAFAELQGRQN